MIRAATEAELRQVTNKFKPIDTRSNKDAKQSPSSRIVQGIRTNSDALIPYLEQRTGLLHQRIPYHGKKRTPLEIAKKEGQTKLTESIGKLMSQNPKRKVQRQEPRVRQPQKISA